MISAPFCGRRAAGWVVALLVTLSSTADAQIQQAYYQGGGQQVQLPYFARLLGTGSSNWVDAHGDPAVVPANYCGPSGCGPMGGMPGGCNSCGGGGCVGGAGPYGPGGPYNEYGLDPSLDAYGNPNVGVDQCGPHFFDFSVEAMYWKKERPADPAVNFATIGITNVSLGVADSLLLSTDDVEAEWEPGMRLTGRYDLGAMSLLEVSYSGLFEYGASSQLNGAGNIYTAFSNFGIGIDTDNDSVPDQAIGGAGIDSTEQANFARLELLSELHNSEISIRRYWIGFNPRVTGTFLAGVRYTRLSEALNFSTAGTGGNAFFATQTENDLVGFQSGGDIWVTVRQGIRIGAQGKAGIYNNRMESAKNITSTELGSELVEVVKGNHVSFIGEGGVSMVCDVRPSWSLRAGYDVMFINTVALAANNFDFNNAPFLGGTRTPVLIEESSALYHGANLGLEYVW